MSDDQRSSAKISRPTELTDQQRADLGNQLDTRNLASVYLGFAQRDKNTIVDECLMVEIPGSPAGEVSVCGAKDFLIDEVRRFTGSDGTEVDVRCASMAVLEMTDSPVHVHAQTLEYYIVQAGEGRMLLGNEPNEKVVEVREGSVIVLPPGQAHGIVSNDPSVPIKALLIFTPGLAPKQQPEFRDEKILFARTSQRLSQVSK